MTAEQEILHWKRMVRLYKFDYLTGLKQRHDFEVETMHKMTKQKFYLAMYDVTGLHKVNREEGYAAGDALVKQVANCIERQDGLWEVYRIGGDEFMALYFDEPDVDSVPNATGAYVYSDNYQIFNKLVSAVDILVTEKKVKFKRRRSDD